MRDSSAPAFKLAQMFLLNAHFAYLVNPFSLPPNTPIKPQRINVSMGLETSTDNTASVVRVIVEADRDDEDALYFFGVEIGAVVQDVDREKFPDSALVEAVATMIFPFLRETVANLTMRGRFGVVWLSPFEVQAALREGLEAQEAQQEAGT